MLEWQWGEGWGGGKEQEMGGKDGEKLHWYGLEGRQKMGKLEASQGKQTKGNRVRTS